MGAVKNEDIAGRQVGCQENKKPRQVTLGNMDLLFSLLLLLLEMGLR